MPDEAADRERRLISLQKEANLLRAQRDDLNNQARGAADERDQHNARVRALVNEANEHKKRRDQLNEQVREQKKLRDELNVAAEEANRKLDELRRTRLPREGRSSGLLHRELKRLEFEHMTKALTPAKEKALIEEIGRLQRELREKDRALESDSELKTASDHARQSKDRAERQHEKVGELAQRAQGEHESMVKLFGESDRLRKVADGVQEKFVQIKTEADKVHKTYVDIVDKIHAIEDEIRAIRAGLSTEQVRNEAEQQQALANHIFERFRKGEKLSTEDLMSLQKAGLL